MVMNGLLPIGSVVLLKDSTKKVMIVGIGQRSVNNPDKVYDYAAVFYPEGFLSPEKLFLFDSNQLAEIYMVGFQDASQLSFNEAAYKELRSIRKQDSDNGNIF